MPQLPPPVLLLFAWLALLSAATFALYAVDKAAARRGGRRIPEATLHLLALCGGWPGALLARRLLRHKTAKAGFTLLFRASAAANCAALAWLWPRLAG